MHKQTFTYCTGLPASGILFALMFFFSICGFSQETNSLSQIEGEISKYSSKLDSTQQLFEVSKNKYQKLKTATIVDGSKLGCYMETSKGEIVVYSSSSLTGEQIKQQELAALNTKGAELRKEIKEITGKIDALKAEQAVAEINKEKAEEELILSSFSEPVKQYYATWKETGTLKPMQGPLVDGIVGTTRYNITILNVLDSKTMLAEIKIEDPATENANNSMLNMRHHMSVANINAGRGNYMPPPSFRGLPAYEVIIKDLPTDSFFDGKKQVLPHVFEVKGFANLLGQKIPVLLPVPFFDSHTKK